MNCVTSRAIRAGSTASTTEACGGGRALSKHLRPLRCTPPGTAASEQSVAVVIYLSDESALQDVEAAVDDLLAHAGLQALSATTRCSGRGCAAPGVDTLWVQIL